VAPLVQGKSGDYGKKSDPGARKADRPEDCAEQIRQGPGCLFESDIRHFLPEKTVSSAPDSHRLRYRRDRNLRELFPGSGCASRKRIPGWPAASPALQPVLQVAWQSNTPLRQWHIQPTTPGWNPEAPCW